MTEEKNSKIVEKKTLSKTSSYLLRALVLLGLLMFGYFIFQNVKKHEAQKELQKFDNIDSEIFDLSISADDAQDGSGVHDFSDVAVNDLREKGAEFIYQMLLKNQVQISALSKQVDGLNEEISKYKNQQRISKMILLYVDLRQEFLNDKPFSKNLENFELVAASDSVLSEKISHLKTALKKFVAKKDLQKSFSKIIPELIVAKKINNDNSLISKFQAKLSKFIIIRRIDGKNPNEIDAKIVKIEKYLEEENYQEAMNILLSLEQKYHSAISNFLEDLSAVIEVQSIDKEILNYLKSLS